MKSGINPCPSSPLAFLPILFFKVSWVSNCSPSFSSRSSNNCLSFSSPKLPCTFTSPVSARVRRSAVSPMAVLFCMLILMVSSSRVNASVCCSFVLSSASCMSFRLFWSGSIILETCSLFCSPNSSCLNLSTFSEVVCICSRMRSSWLFTCSSFIFLKVAICPSWASLVWLSCFSKDALSSVICCSYVLLMSSRASAFRFVSVLLKSAAVSSCFFRLFSLSALNSLSCFAKVSLSSFSCASNVVFCSRSWSS